jgi:hypothetical protein
MYEANSIKYFYSTGFNTVKEPACLSFSGFIVGSALLHAVIAKKENAIRIGLVIFFYPVCRVSVVVLPLMFTKLWHLKNVSFNKP